MNKYILWKYIFYLVSALLINSAFSQNESEVGHSNIQLFQADSIINIDIWVNLKTLISDNGYNARYHDAKLVYINEWNSKIRIDCELKCRGRFRIKEENCNFPPLMIKFGKKEVKNTLFEDLDKIKLVTQCQVSQKSYESFLLREFLAYRIYNLVTNYSYKVRLARISYRDEFSTDVITNYGFFVEPIELLTQRVKGSEYTRNIHPNAVDQKSSGLFFIYQFLIGNTDWAIRNQHNTTLVEVAPSAPPIPIPFDLDFSGIVNAPYAIPAKEVPVNSVKERYYFGYCRSKDVLDSAIRTFSYKKDVIYQLVKQFNVISSKEKANILNYFDQFYRIIDNPKKTDKDIVKKCRTD